ncbi:MAG: glycoside hydrolase family 92 protein, partial [Sphingobacteriales bacterium]|nr:glycoside hydrolase family 92 protein [Sphingobacteriales bacterium]
AISLMDMPASCFFKIEMICVSVNRTFFIIDPFKLEIFSNTGWATFGEPYSSAEASNHTVYNGWSIWDNYKTQLPLLSIAYPKQYQDIVSSIVNLYNYGKKDWATLTEPSNTVRTEHAVVVLLDAYRKGYKIDFSPIIDSLIKESEHLDFSHPDKAMESSYDLWALSEILTILHKESLATMYRQKVLQYQKVWTQNFRDISKPDVDDYGARGMYQGTVWQYRWFVPFDQKGIVELCGGDSAYIAQLDQFFGNDFYNAANEPDIQAPYLYNFSSQPWKSQEMIHRYAKDTVVQYYTDINYRGVNPQIGRIYNNRPDAFLQSMDDDAGAMSSWYVLAACGLSPACVGEPVYYLSVPLFEHVAFNKTFVITVKNFKPANKYIQSVSLNGRNLDKNWITQDEIMKGGRLVITASDKPNKAFGIRNQWMTTLIEN